MMVKLSLLFLDSKVINNIQVLIYTVKKHIVYSTEGLYESMKYQIKLPSFSKNILLCSYTSINIWYSFLWVCWGWITFLTKKPVLSHQKMVVDRNPTVDSRKHSSVNIHFVDIEWFKVEYINICTRWVTLNHKLTDFIQLFSLKGLTFLMKF